jgi:hypothetical protein
MFYPGSLNFPSRIWIPKFFIPDPGSKKAPERDENKANLFFLLLMVSGTSFINKEIKEQGFLRRSRQKNIPSGYGIRKKFIPDPGGKKAPDPDPHTAPVIKK